MDTALRLYDNVRVPSKPCEFVCVLLDFSRKCSRWCCPVLWHLSCCLKDSASLSPSRARELAGGERLKMIKLIRELLVIAMLGVVSVSAFAQRKDKDQDKRPKKEPVIVITNDRKDQKPPRQNDNQRPPKPKKP